MEILNRPLRALFDALLAPLRGLDPMVGVTLVSLVVAVGMLWIFKRTSNQEKLAVVKRHIHAGLFEIRLFNDDLRAILRSQGDILRHNLRYLVLSLPPLLFILPPLFFVVAQLQFHYGYEGLEVGSPTLLEVRLEEDWERPGAVTASGRPKLELRLGDGLRLDSVGVWAPSERTMTWRVVPERRGSWEATVSLGDESATKSVVASDAVVRRSPNRVKGALGQLIYPAEPPIAADAPFEEITVRYPERWDVGVAGLRTQWVIVFFVLSIVFAFALRNRMGVTI